MSPLTRDLEALDRRPYPAYKELRRPYDHGTVRFVLEHVPGDPFAARSRLRVDLPPEFCALPPFAREGAVARPASADFLHRAAARTL